MEQKCRMQSITVQRRGSSVAAGSPAETILELAKANGKKGWSITTTVMTHATPAATFAHVCNRNAQYEIARLVFWVV